MPKTKPFEQDLKARAARGVIRHALETSKLDEEEVAVRMHIVKRTLQNKIKRPETFRLDELWKLAEVLRLPPEDVAEILIGKRVSKVDIT